MEGTVPCDPYGIDTHRRQLLGFERKIGSGKSQFAAQFAARDHFAQDRIVAAKKLSGYVKLPRFHCKTDACAADRLVANANWIEPMNLEAVAFTKKFQGRNGAAAAFAKRPLPPDANAPQGIA